MDTEVRERLRRVVTLIDAGLADLRAILAAEGVRAEQLPTLLPLPGNKMWSPERSAIVLRGYAEDWTTEKIQDHVNLLPGRFVPKDRISVQAALLGVKRSERFRQPPSSGRPATPKPPPFAVPVAPKLFETTASVEKQTSPPPVVERKPVSAPEPKQIAPVVSLVPKPAAPPASPAKPSGPEPGFTMLGGSLDPADIRGKPGVWYPPVTKSLSYIYAAAMKSGLFERFRLEDLPRLNKHRAQQGYPPLAVKMGKPSPGDWK